MDKESLCMCICSVCAVLLSNNLQAATSHSHTRTVPVDVIWECCCWRLPILVIGKLLHKGSWGFFVLENWTQWNTFMYVMVYGYSIHTCMYSIHSGLSRSILESVCVHAFVVHRNGWGSGTAQNRCIGAEVTGRPPNASKVGQRPCMHIGVLVHWDRTRSWSGSTANDDQKRDF